MKILVTGGAGFIASNIADAYIRDGHEVVVVDNLFSGREKNLSKKAKFHKLDVCSPGLEGLFEKYRFDLVNHHAAHLDVRRSVENPIFDAQMNIVGSLNLLENSVKYAVKKFIFASSGGVMYGETGNRPNPDESRPALPVSPYGVSKLAVENYLRYYSAVRGLKSTILRYGNVYGPRQDPHGEAGVVAIFSKAMLEKEKVKIFGNGNQERDFVFVGDIVTANVLALEKGDGHTLNLGTGKTASVNELFRIMKSITHYYNEPVYEIKRTGELERSSLNVENAKQVLGWEAKMQLASGLAKTVNYFMGEEIET